MQTITSVRPAILRLGDPACGDPTQVGGKAAHLSRLAAEHRVPAGFCLTAATSAVVFSANPITGNRDEVVVTASWGLGESVVSGTVTPDTWVVRKADLAVGEERIGAKERMTVAVPGGTREVAVPRLLRGRASLNGAQVAELAGLAVQLEEGMGRPVDIEAAFAGDLLYLLQSRPITTLAEPDTNTSAAA